MQRDQLPEHKRPTYVLPAYKTVYVAVSKAACTSLKWLIADIQGEDPERFAANAGRMVTRDMCIHHRESFKRTPMLESLTDEELAEIRPGNGWFIFTVVRHPGARLFSAWQSKLLLREPKYYERHREAAWFPRVPRSTEDIVEDFRGFALALAAADNPPLLHNRHFMAQWRAAAPDRVPYSRTYDTSEIPLLMEELGRHLREHGYAGELRLRESNETPLKAIAAAFPDEVQAAIRTIYADDFAGFDYEHALPPKLDPANAYTEAQIAEIGRLIERHERIGDLAGMAMRFKQELREARKAAAAARGEPPRGSVARRLLRALR